MASDRTEKEIIRMFRSVAPGQTEELLYQPKYPGTITSIWADSFAGQETELEYRFSLFPNSETKSDGSRVDLLKTVDGSDDPVFAGNGESMPRYQIRRDYGSRDLLVIEVENTGDFVYTASAFFEIDSITEGESGSLLSAITGGLF